MHVLDVEQSVNGCRWIYKESDSRLALTIQQRYGLPEIVARILASRSISLENVEAFLYPTLKQHLPNPFTLKDMEKQPSEWRWP